MMQIVTRVNDDNSDDFHPVTLAGEAMEFAYVSERSREQAEKAGHALSGGRYPIRDVTDLKAAIKAYGRGNPSDKPKIRRHIIRQAHRLDKGDLIPSKWKETAIVTPEEFTVPTLEELVAPVVSPVDTTMQVPSAAVFKDYSEEQRDKMAKAGIAMDDGSYPIANKADLKNAIQAYGRSSNKPATKKHIISRAKQLDAVEMLPESWGITASAGTVNDEFAQGAVTRSLQEYNQDVASRDQISLSKATAVYRRGVRGEAVTASGGERHTAGMERLASFFAALVLPKADIDFQDADLLPTWHPSCSYWSGSDCDPVVAAVAARRQEIDPTWGLHVFNRN